MKALPPIGAMIALFGGLRSAIATESPVDAEFIVRVCAGIVSEQISVSNGIYTDPNGSRVELSEGGTLKITRPGVPAKIINNIGKGDYNSCIAGILQEFSTTRLKNCRIPQNGVERYTRQFVVTLNSPEMSGGHSQGEWCNSMITNLRGQHPNGNFTPVNSSESSRSGCSPFNCPLYTYQCTVSVETDPIFKEAAACLP